MEVTFPPHHRWIFDRDTMTFPAVIAGRQITCSIPMETLMSSYGLRGPSEEEAEAAFVANRAAIEVRVREVIEQVGADDLREVMVSDTGNRVVRRAAEG
jgi:hypothetical protein